MGKDAHTIDAAILRSMRASRSAAAFSPGQFAKLGQPAAVRKALSRLAEKGKIRRLRRGLYDLPRSHPIIGETAPDPMATARALMEGSSADWQLSGAYAANLLGLSDQVPGQVVILTNGPPRRVSLGKLTLVFRRAAPRNLLGAGRPAGLVIQAIRHLRESGMTPARVALLRRRLDSRTKADLRALAPKLPAWMHPIIAEIADTTEP
ncbi:MAG: type IV toxin-antitoxin system AbiEi family antitoxin domain-containing protein [Planctomycetes bacterium]|nr:type IV toxin-antitoxin system AbiEi family antitoxin domain-containing protein [Planctomycetota bacterium]